MKELVSLLPLLLILVLFWLLAIRPQQRRNAALARLQASLEVGDEVMLSSGFLGIVRGFDDDRVRIELADGVVVQVVRGAIHRVVEQVMDEVGALDGTSAIRQALSTARRALRDDADTERASREIAGALEEQRTEAQWRTAAARTLAEPLARYEASIRDTIGLRQQPRLNDELAARIALCTAHHRDISLNF